MYRTTISFNNSNNRTEGEPNNRYNKLIKTSRYNKTSKSISIVWIENKYKPNSKKELICSVDF